MERFLRMYAGTICLVISYRQPSSKHVWIVWFRASLISHHLALGSRLGASWNEWIAVPPFARRRWRGENDLFIKFFCSVVWPLQTHESQLGRSWSRRGFQPKNWYCVRSILWWQMTSPPMWIVRLDAWGWLLNYIRVSIFRSDERTVAPVTPLICPASLLRIFHSGPSMCPI